MRAYLSVVSARFRTLLQYRAAASAGFGTQLFWGAVRIMIFSAFYSSSSQPAPLSQDQMINYVWLGQALLLLIPFRSDGDIIGMIRTGNICYELIRPVRLYGYWFAREIAHRTAPVMLRALPMLVVVAVVFPIVGWESWALGGPVSAGAFALFLLSLLAAVLLSCSLSLVLYTTLFWTVGAEGIQNLVPVLIWTFSGIIIPIPFYPDWMQPIFRLLPFRGLIDVPFRIYLGSIAMVDALYEIGIQLVWVAALIALANLLLHRGLSRVVVQGG